MNKINELHTYINLNGKPLLRRCENCEHWKRIEDKKNGSEPTPTGSGYCMAIKLIFAYTLKPIRNYQSKYCDLCENHRFANEAELEATAKKILLSDVVKDNSIKISE